ncbi:MAG: VacB/RNase II family 3'-5' exoribonuclease [Thermodesulfobacteriota bacterium]
MKQPSYHPLRSRELAQRLGVPREQRAVFKRLLRGLLGDGKVTRNKGGRYLLPGTRHAENPKVPGRQLVKSPVYGKKIVGRVVRTGKTGMVVLKNVKLPPLVISPSEMKGARSGSLVVAEASPPKGRDKRPRGTIVEVLGKAGRLDTEKKGLSVEYELPTEFPRNVEAEAKRVSEEVREEDLRGRKDLRGKLCFTIDGDSAKDFDDAVAIMKTRGGYRLWVSIADVSHYVSVGTALDNEALERATSIYLTDKVVPMLPEELSNWVCSLMPDEDRLTKTVELDYDREGTVKGSKIYNSVIRSRARLTYTAVTEALEGNAGGARLDGEIKQSLAVMRELYERLKKSRVEKGELDFDFPDPELIQDELGRTVDVIKSTRNVAHGIIEEFMIAANTAVAERVFTSKRHSVYRIHEPPDLDSIRELAEDLKKFGHILKVGREVRAQDLQKIIFEAKGGASQVAVHTMVLRALSRAVYSTNPLAHFGLAIAHYTHFTSPIRRYPDLVVHRIINSLVCKRATPCDEETLEWISAHCSAKERFADEVEREVLKLEKVEMMKSHVGKEFEGVVISVMPFGMFVELEDYFVDGMVPREKIRPRGKKYDLGDHVRVKLVEADLERRRLTFEMVKASRRA